VKINSLAGNVTSTQTVNKPEVKSSEAKQSQQVANEIRKDMEPEEIINDEMLEKSIEQANKSLQFYDKRIERTVHETTKTIMYTIKDTKTDEVISEFPPKKIQDMIAKMWELAGLFMDEKA